MISEPRGFLTRAALTEAWARVRHPLDRSVGFLRPSVELLGSVTASVLLRNPARDYFEPDPYAAEMPFLSDAWPLV